MELFLSGLFRGVSYGVAGRSRQRRQGKSFLIKMLIYVFFPMQFLMRTRHANDNVIKRPNEKLSYRKSTTAVACWGKLLIGSMEAVEVLSYCLQC